MTLFGVPLQYQIQEHYILPQWMLMVRVAEYMLFVPTQQVFYQTLVRQDFMEEIQALEGENK